MSNNQTVSDVVLGTAWTVTPGVIASTAVGAHARSTVVRLAVIVASLLCLLISIIHGLQ